MLHDEEETAEVEVGAGHILFDLNGLTVHSVLMEGAFPPIDHVVPKLYLTEAEAATQALLRAAERVSVLAGADVVRLAASPGKLSLLSKTPEIGEVRDEVPLKDLRGEPFALSLNGRFLIDALRCLDSEFVRLRFAGKMSPVVMIPGNEASSSALFLITPIRSAD